MINSRKDKKGDNQPSVGEEQVKDYLENMDFLGQEDQLRVILEYSRN